MAPQILFFMIVMLMVGGIAVDVMRFETKRVALQQTMDRAVLAAANLENSLDPQTVVLSYLAAAGSDATLSEFAVVTDDNGRTVRARANVISDNYFMTWMNVDYLETDNRSMAAQTVSNVEISMVLDVSGSMQNTPSRILNLKIAAKKFIDDVLDRDEYDRISISIVPYNGQVNVGPTLFSKFNVTHLSGMPDSYCLDLPTETYDRTWLSRVLPYPQTPHVDSWSSATTNNSYTNVQAPTFTNGRFSNMWCQPTPENYVMVHSNDRVALKAKIEGMVAIGATSMDLGMKWGTALLDPEARSIVSEMVDASQIPEYFEGRPGNFGDAETLKVVIIMTDGENFVQERHGDGPIGTEAYRAGPSPIWKANNSNLMSIFYEDRVNNSTTTTRCNSRPFYVPHLGTLGEWHSRPWNGTSPASNACYVATSTYSGATKQTWQNVWAQARTKWVAWQLYGRALGGNNATSRTDNYNLWLGRFTSTTAIAMMNTRFDQLCEVAKSQGILIYGIAFEAPPGGQSAIQGCASEPSQTYYYPAQGSDIGTAFALIAANLSQLRLTQ